jgi:hypothetical protein
MVEQLKPVVTRVAQDFRLTPTGMERQIRIEYMVGQDGPFSFTLPEAEFTAVKVQEEINKRAAELAQLPRA